MGDQLPVIVFDGAAEFAIVEFGAFASTREMEFEGRMGPGSVEGGLDRSQHSD